MTFKVDYAITKAPACNRYDCIALGRVIIAGPKRYVERKVESMRAKGLLGEPNGTGAIYK